MTLTFTLTVTVTVTLTVTVTKLFTSHVPFMSCLSACVEGKARDKHQQEVEGQAEKRRCQKSSLTLVSWVRERGYRRHSSHLGLTDSNDRRPWVAKKVFSHEHGATEFIKDIAMLGFNEIILKCDGEPFGTHGQCGVLSAAAELVPATPIFASVFGVRESQSKDAQENMAFGHREYKGPSDAAQLAPEDILARVYDSLERNSVRSGCCMPSR